MTSVARLRDALRLAVVGLEALVDPDPQKGILTCVKQQGEAQGVSLDMTYNAVVDLIAVLRAELGESNEGIDHLSARLEARSIANQFGALRADQEEALALLRAARGEAMTHELHERIVAYLERREAAERSQQAQDETA